MSSEQSDFKELGINIPRDVASRGNGLEVSIFLLAAISRGIGSIAPDTDVLRGILPDPIDVPNHVANAAVTVGLLSMVSRGFNGTKPQTMTAAESEHSRRTFLYTVGALTVAANAFGELVGYGKISTPDPYDFIYGLAGGALAYRWLKPAFISPDEVRNIKDTYPEGNATRQYVTRFVPDAATKPQLQTNRSQPKKRQNAARHHNPRASKKRR